MSSEYFNIEHASKFSILVSSWCFCIISFRSSRPEVFLGKAVPKISSKFTGEHPCRSGNFIEITPQHGCSPVNLLYVFRILFPRNTLVGCFCSFYLMHLLHEMYFVHVILFNVLINCRDRVFFPFLGKVSLKHYLIIIRECSLNNSSFP